MYMWLLQGARGAGGSECTSALQVQQQQYSSEAATLAAMQRQQCSGSLLAC
jgi:hypothetical protein